MVRWLLLFVLIATGAMAAESAPVRTARTTATIVSDRDGVAPGQAVRLGLRLRIAPGWHVYWKNPGDAGIAPELTLDGAQGGPILWPTPVRLPEGPLMTYGYTGEVLLPLVATAQGRAVTATASWLVCEKICVPEDATLTLALDGPPGTAPEATLFVAADARMPRPSPFVATVADGVLSLAGPGLSSGTVRAAWFMPDTPDAIVNPAVQRLTVRDGGLSLALVPGPGFAPPLTGVVVMQDAGGQESAWVVEAKPGAALSGAALSGVGLPGVPPVRSPLIETLLLALTGGLILNLMPCVFPVLAMKAMAVARLSGAAQGAMRREGLAYTAGVLVAFGGLGAALVAIRAAGGAAGWGFQLQSPVFVLAMAWVLFAVGLNLSGVYEVRLAGAGAGQGLASRGGMAGSFFTGLLAVLVATPCTAPFMGAAIAAALAAPAVVAMLVFGALGLGFAAPYLVLSVVPGVARLLPRPGAWMDVLRGALAFPMYGAAVWLLWVVSLQAGPSGVLAGAAGAVLLGFAAWSAGQAQRRGGQLGRVIAAAACVAALAVLVALPTAPVGAATTEAGPNAAQVFSRTRLAALRAEGRPVFVNMTAAWCVTCLVNERLALAPAAVQARLAAGITYLKGDWTRQDPEITAFLTEHGRDGVPLYVFYPAHGPAVVLPQILTESAVLAAFDGA